MAMAPAAAADNVAASDSTADAQATSSFGWGDDDDDFIVSVEDDIEADSGSDVEVDINIESTKEDSGFSWFVPRSEKINWFELRVEYDADNLNFNDVVGSELSDVEVKDEGDGYFVIKNSKRLGNYYVDPDEDPDTLITADFSVTGDEGSVAAVEPTDDSRIGWGPNYLKKLSLFQHDVEYQPGEVQIGDGPGDGDEGEEDEGDEEEGEEIEFSAVNTGGFIAFGEDTESGAHEEGIEFPADGIEIEGVIADDGTWESTSVEFQPLSVEGLEANVEAPGGLEGEIDRDDDFLTSEGELEVTIFGDSFSFEIAATSEDSGALSGDADLGDDAGTATLVDNEYIVDDTTGNILIDGTLDLPIEESGLNWLELPLEFDFAGDADDDPAETGALDVDVTDQNGDAIEDASVEVDGETVQTDANGQASFDELDVGTYDVTVEAAGQTEVVEDVEIEADTTSSVSVTIEVPPETGSLDVDVTDQNGDAIENAAVEVDGETVQTDANGQASFDELEVGTYDVTVEAAGQTETVEDVEIEADTTTSVSVTIEVPPETGSLDVDVTDQNGDAIEDASVEVDGETVQTDANGLASFDELEVGTYDVTVEAEGETETVEDVEIEADTTTSVSVTIEVPPETGSLDVDVTDQNGDAIEDASVEVDGETVQTDASGQASFDELDVGTYDVTVEAAGQTEVVEDVEIETDTTTSVSVTIEVPPETGSLDVDVSDQNGDAIEGASVEVDGETIQTDANGLASFDELEVGTYDVTVEAEGETETVEGVEIEADTTTSVSVTIELPPETGSLDVEVADQNGDAVENAAVEVDGETVQTDASGQASFDELEVGTYDVDVSAHGVSESTTATVEADTTTSVGVQLDLTGSLEVTVTDGDGAGIEDVAVTIDDGQSAQTDANGAASFTLDAGTYDVTVDVDGETQTETIDIEPATTATLSFSFDLVDEFTFTATNTGGFISFDEDNIDDAHDEGLTFPTEEEDGEGIVIEGVAEDGTWESTSVDFPLLNTEDDGSGFDAETIAPNGLSGEIDRENDHMTAEGTLQVTVLATDDTFEFDIAQVTEFSNGAASPDGLEGYANFEENFANLVDNEYIVEDTTGNLLLDSELGLPITEPGLAWLELPMEFEFSDDE